MILANYQLSHLFKRKKIISLSFLEGVREHMAEQESVQFTVVDKRGHKSLTFG